MICSVAFLFFVGSRCRPCSVKDIWVRRRVSCVDIEFKCLSWARPDPSHHSGLFGGSHLTSRKVLKKSKVYILAVNQICSWPPVYIHSAKLLTPVLARSAKLQTPAFAHSALVDTILLSYRTPPAQGGSVRYLKTKSKFYLLLFLFPL